MWKHSTVCNWKLLVIPYNGQDGHLCLILTFMSVVRFMVRPQVLLANQYWQKHFVLSIEMSPPPISDVSWNQQLLTKQSPHCSEDIRQRSFLGQSVGQKPNSTGEGRRWEHKIRVTAECANSCWLSSPISLLSILCRLGFTGTLKLVSESFIPWLLKTHRLFHSSGIVL